MPRVKRSSRLDLLADSESDWEIKQAISQFFLEYPKIKQLKERLRLEMELGLSDCESERRRSSLLMAPTFVKGVVNGSERGTFLALDLGGTNFRILDVALRSGSRCFSSCQDFAIPPDRLAGSVAGLFEFVADKVEQFVADEGIREVDGRRIPLGFTFSYPVRQTSLTTAAIERVNKAMKLHDAVGEDPARLLQRALDDRRLPIEVAALLNDTTGTLMCGAFADSACCVGLILGTGSNVCYVEKASRVPLCADSRDDFVIVNTEWGAFGDNRVIDFLKTEFDFQLDQASLHAGTYTFEKLFSGMYLGELARVTLAHLCQRGLVFGGRPSERLLTPGSLPSSFVSRVERDSHRDLSQTHRCLKELRLETISDEDYHVVRFLANALSVRAAQIVAAGLSVVIERIDRPEVAVAVDGSLYSKHPTLPSLMQEFLDRYCDGKHVRVILAEDGSGKGAAFTAAVAARIREEEEEEEDHASEE